MQFWKLKNECAHPLLINTTEELIELSEERIHSVIKCIQYTTKWCLGDSDNKGVKKLCKSPFNPPSMHEKLTKWSV